MKKLSILFASLFAFSLSANAHMDGESVAKLPTVNGGSDAQKEAVRKGAKEFCEDKEDDQREECVMDFYANHNLEEEPSCD
jgi:hypothetical protein